MSFACKFSLFFLTNILEGVDDWMDNNDNDSSTPLPTNISTHLFPNIFQQKLRELRELRETRESRGSGEIQENTENRENVDELRPEEDRFIDFHENCLLETPLMHHKFNDKVIAMDFSPCGNYLAVCSIDGSMVVYTIDGFKTLNAINIKTEGIYCLRYSPDSKLIAVGGDDLKVMIFDSKTLKYLFSFTGHTGCIQDIVWTYENDELKVISVSMDATMRVWNMNTRESEYIFSDHLSDINSIAISSNGSFVFTCADDSSVNVYDFFNRDHFLILKPHFGPIYSVDTNIDGYLASSSLDGTVALYSQDDWKLVKTMKFRENIIRNVQFSPHGETLAVCVYGQIYAISLSNFKIVITFRNEDEPNQTLGCRWHNSGKFLVSSDEKYNLYVWKNPLFVTKTANDDFKSFTVPDYQNYLPIDAKESLDFAYKSYFYFLETSKIELINSFSEKLKGLDMLDVVSARLMSFFEENIQQFYSYFKADAEIKYKNTLKKIGFEN